MTICLQQFFSASGFNSSLLLCFMITCQCPQCISYRIIVSVVIIVIMVSLYLSSRHINVIVERCSSWVQYYESLFLHCPLWKDWRLIPENFPSFTQWGEFMNSFHWGRVIWEKRIMDRGRVWCDSILISVMGAFYRICVSFQARSTLQCKEQEKAAVIIMSAYKCFCKLILGKQGHTV